MAKASIEIGGIDFALTAGSSINGACVHQEELAVSSSTTISAAITSAQVTSSNGFGIARVAVDVDSYVATGTAPDPTLTDKTAVSTARRYLSAGSSIELKISAGDKIAVKAF